MDFSYIINNYKISERQGYLDVSLPIVMDMSENNCNLILTILPDESGYEVYSTDGMFKRSGYSAKECFDRYAADENNCTYGIKLEGGRFTKKYSSSDNPVFALDDFIKFFVLFNEFVMRGGEEVDW